MGSAWILEEAWVWFRGFREAPAKRGGVGGGGSGGGDRGLPLPDYAWRECRCYLCFTGDAGERPRTRLDAGWCVVKRDRGVCSPTSPPPPIAAPSPIHPPSSFDPSLVRRSVISCPARAPEVRASRKTSPIPFPLPSVILSERPLTHDSAVALDLDFNYDSFSIPVFVFGLDWVFGIVFVIGLRLDFDFDFALIFDSNLYFCFDFDVDSRLIPNRFPFCIRSHLRF